MTLGILGHARTRPYRRRRRTPIVAVVAVLAVAAAVTWTSVLVGAAGPAGPDSCPASPAGPVPGTVLASDVLDAVAPAPPPVVRTRVLNAGGERGKANLVSAQLEDLGFGTADAPSNDPFHPDGDMNCVGQLRFGPAGEAAASMLSLVLPCAELVRDDRPDDSVDVAVGTAFGDVAPARVVRQVIDTLGGDGNGDGSGSTDAPMPPDPAELAQARGVSC